MIGERGPHWLKFLVLANSAHDLFVGACGHFVLQLGHTKPLSGRHGFQYGAFGVVFRSSDIHGLAS